MTQRILFIDDQAAGLSLGLQGLSRFGFSLTSIEYAEHTFPAIDSVRPDVVLLDLDFPGDHARPESTGARLLREIRVKHPDLPVVIYTSTASDASKRHEELPAAQFRYAKTLIDERRASGLDPVSDLSKVLRRAIDANSRNAAAAAAKFNDWPPIARGQSERAKQLRASLVQAASRDEPLWLVGGPGSELHELAQVVHQLSRRPAAQVFDARQAPFPESLTAPAAASEPTTAILQHVEQLDPPGREQLARNVREPTSAQAHIRWILTTESRDAKLATQDELSLLLTPLRIDVPPLAARIEQDLDEIAKTILDDVVARAAARGESHSNLLRADTAARLRAHHWSQNIVELRAALLGALRKSNVVLPENLILAPSPAATVSAQHSMPAVDDPDPDAAEARWLAERIIALPDKDPRRHALLIQERPRKLRKLLCVALIRYLRERDGHTVQWGHLCRFVGSPDAKADGALRGMMSTAGVAISELSFNK